MKSIIRNQSGQGLSEYMILLFLIAIVSVGVVQSLGGLIKRKLTTARDQIEEKAVLERRR